MEEELNVRFIIMEILRVYPISFSEKLEVEFCGMTLQLWTKDFSVGFIDSR